MRLTKSDQELIEGLLRKDPLSLTQKDKAILSARRDYLTKDEYERMVGTQENKDTRVKEQRKDKKE